VSDNDVLLRAGGPIRLQLVDVLRKRAGKVCVCELVPLFEITETHRVHERAVSAIIRARKP
jgi:ArsR family transcriptional regulator